MTNHWETRAVPSLARQTVHEPGWEPFAVSDGLVWLRRRCEAVVAVRSPPPIALTTREIAGRQIAERALEALVNPPRHTLLTPAGDVKLKPKGTTP